MVNTNVNNYKNLIKVNNYKNLIKLNFCVKKYLYINYKLEIRFQN